MRPSPRAGCLPSSANILRAASAEIESRSEEIADTLAREAGKPGRDSDVAYRSHAVGGVKDSGLGRDGPRYTIEEMTELKLMVINRP